MLSYCVNEASYDFIINLKIRQGKNLLNYLMLQREWNLKIPEWAEKIYPDVKKAVLANDFKELVGTRELKKLLSGK